MTQSSGHLKAEAFSATQFKLADRKDAITMPAIMIAQQELQHLLTLPVVERLQLAQSLIESTLREAVGLPAAENGEAHPGISAQQPSAEKKIPFRSLQGLYSGEQTDMGERADEIFVRKSNLLAVSL